MRRAEAAPTRARVNEGLLPSTGEMDGTSLIAIPREEAEFWTEFSPGFRNLISSMWVWAKRARRSSLPYPDNVSARESEERNISGFAPPQRSGIWRTVE